MQTLNGNWKLALDPHNEGREGQWFTTIRPEAVDAPVPGNIKQVFPGAQGVAWYWLAFRAAESPGPGERMLLRFGAVDYLADVWLNGQAVGSHEGGETPFTLDVTEAWRPAAENLLAVRVLSPANDPIDGLRLKEVPHSAGWQFGGIVLPVEWERSPAARIADVFVEPESGTLQMSVTVQNGSGHAQAAAEPEVACWRAHEFVFTSDRDYAAPLADVAVSATFTHEDGTRIVRPVFWDGERTWRVRFAPTKAGTWSMLTDCSEAADGGLSWVRRSLRAVPYEGELAVYRHGFLTIAANGRYLTHADGTPFLWASEDHACMDKESWSESNKPGTASQFRHIADLRRQQGLNVYQSVVWALSYWQTPQRPNLERFHDLDRKYAYLADLGFVSAIALGYHKDLGDGEPDPEKVAAMKLMARYVEGRYGAYPMAYYTCGEFNIPCEGKGAKDPSRVGPENSYIRSWWGEIGAVIHAHNSYGHPSSINYWQPQGTWFSDLPFHRYWTLQGYTLRDPGYYAYWHKQEPAKPIIDPFSGMDHGTEESQRTQRAIGWVVMQSGGAGFGCLTEGIWNNCYTKDSGICVEHWGGTPWFTTVDWPAAAQIGHVRKFYSSIDWWRLKPQSRGGRFQPHQGISLSADGMGTFVVYFGNQGDATGTLDLVPERSYRARWFDPRHGAFTEEIPVTVATGGTWEIPKRPTAGDWTLLVQPVAWRSTTNPARW